MVQESFDGHQRSTRISNFNAIIENLHHRTRACNEEVLMDHSICDQFPYRRLRERRYRLSERFSDHFIRGKQTVDEARHGLEACRVAALPDLLAQCRNPAICTILNDPNSFAVKVANVFQILREQH